MEPTYPYIARHIVDRNLVVLFTQPGVGYCIRQDSHGLNRLNVLQYDWVERNFEYYDWGKDRTLSSQEFNYFCARAQQHGMFPGNVA